MPRDLPIGNGDLLVTFDAQYRVRDIYWPFVGKYNHTGGHVQRFGVWVDGQMAWVEDEGWKRELKYRPDTLVTDVTLTHEALGLVLKCADCVDFHEPVWIRRVEVRDLLGKPRDVRLFVHLDLSIQENPLGDTANYDPQTAGLVLYKGAYYFLINACDETTCGIQHWAIGTKRLGSAEGTWRDAEDGELGRNPIAQGSVDATVGFNLKLEAGGTSHATFWMAVGSSYDQVEHLTKMIVQRTPEKFITRTDAYWRLWVRKEEIDTTILPPAVGDLFQRSQLVLRTQVDNRGAIIAANDTDITHFAGDHYSYCWPRDGALVAYALVRAGQSELSRQFFRFCGQVINKHGYFLHKYAPDGRLASSWHPWTVGGRSVLPVQQDETALVVWALRKHFETFRDVEFIKPLYNALVVQPAKWMVEYRDPLPPDLRRGGSEARGLPKPSWDLWEERRGVHGFTVAATIAGLRAAADFAEDFGDEGRAAYWRRGAAEVEEALKLILWREGEGRVARMVTPVYDDAGGLLRYEHDLTADSANFALFALGALAPEHPIVEAEMQALQRRLGVQTSVGGFARYEKDYYHQVEREKTGEVPGNPWLICTLWQAQYAIARARTLEDLAPAEAWLEWACKRASPSGVLAEQFDPYSGAPISVSPLTWSHATVVIAVMDYLEKHRQLLGKAAEAVRKVTPA